MSKQQESRVECPKCYGIGVIKVEIYTPNKRPTILSGNCDLCGGECYVDQDTRKMFFDYIKLEKEFIKKIGNWRVIE